MYYAMTLLLFIMATNRKKGRFYAYQKISFLAQTKELTGVCLRKLKKIKIEKIPRFNI